MLKVVTVLLFLLLICVILAIVKPASKTPGVKAWLHDLYKMFQFGLRVLVCGALAAVIYRMFHGQ